MTPVRKASVDHLDSTATAGTVSAQLIEQEVWAGSARNVSDTSTFSHCRLSNLEARESDA